jgi:hypothetical protein
MQTQLTDIPDPIRMARLTADAWFDGGLAARLTADPVAVLGEYGLPPDTSFKLADRPMGDLADEPLGGSGPMARCGGCGGCGGCSCAACVACVACR